MKNEKRLETMSWDEIDEIARAGEGQKYFSVGDEKTITLDDGEQVTLQILGFDHDDLADGTGKANITFGMKNLLKEMYAMDDEDYNYFDGETIKGWKNSKMRTETMSMLFNRLPSDLQNVIKVVAKRTTSNKNVKGFLEYSLEISFDKLFLFSFYETNPYKNENLAKILNFYYEGKTYEYWEQKDTNKIKVIKFNDGEFSNWPWWLRTSYSGTGYMLCSNGNHLTPVDHYASSPCGVCFGFCI